MRKQFRDIPMWLYVVLAATSLVFLFFSYDSSDGLKGLCSNLAAESLGILVTVGVLEVYLKQRKKANWRKVEKHVRDRLIRAMDTVTATMEIAAAVRQHHSDSPQGCGNSLLVMVKYHSHFLREELIPKAHEISQPKNYPLFPQMCADLDRFMSVLDSVVGNFSQDLGANLVEGLLALQRQAEHLQIQMSDCPPTPQSVDLPNALYPKEERLAVLGKAFPGFLEVLFSTEEMCAHEYEEVLEDRDK
jgi:hypothetical protein